MDVFPLHCSVTLILSRPPALVGGQPYALAGPVGLLGEGARWGGHLHVQVWDGCLLGLGRAGEAPSANLEQTLRTVPPPPSTALRAVQDV